MSMPKEKVATGRQQQCESRRRVAFNANARAEHSARRLATQLLILGHLLSVKCRKFGELGQSHDLAILHVSCAVANCIITRCTPNEST